MPEFHTGEEALYSQIFSKQEPSRYEEKWIVEMINAYYLPIVEKGRISTEGRELSEKIFSTMLESSSDLTEVKSRIDSLYSVLLTGTVNNNRASILKLFQSIRGKYNMLLAKTSAYLQDKENPKTSKSALRKAKDWRDSQGLSGVNIDTARKVDNAYWQLHEEMETKAREIEVASRQLVDQVIGEPNISEGGSQETPTNISLPRRNRSPSQRLRLTVAAALVVLGLAGDGNVIHGVGLAINGIPNPDGKSSQPTAQNSEETDSVRDQYERFTSIEGDINTNSEKSTNSPPIRNAPPEGSGSMAKSETENDLKEYNDIKLNDSEPISSDFIDWTRAGMEVSREPGGEVLITTPTPTRNSLWYGGTIGGKYFRGDWYQGKEHNAAQTIEDIRNNLPTEMSPGDQFSLIGDRIIRVEGDGYTDTPLGHGSGACWGAHNVISAQDAFNRIAPLQVFVPIGKRPMHDGHIYPTYIDDNSRLEGPEGASAFTGGYTIFQISPGVAKYDQTFMINPELATVFPQYYVTVRINTTFHTGKGPSDPSYAETSYTLILKPKNQALVTSDESQVATIKAEQDRSDQEETKLVRLNIPERYYPPNLVNLNDYSLNATIWKKDESSMIREDALPYIQSFLNDLANIGYTNIFIAHAFRSYQSQSEVKANNPGGAAMPGHSQHQTGYAFDMYQLIDGKLAPIDSRIIEVASKHGIYQTVPGDTPHLFVVRALYGGDEVREHEVMSSPRYRYILEKDLNIVVSNELQTPTNIAKQRQDWEKNRDKQVRDMRTQARQYRKNI